MKQQKNHTPKCQPHQALSGSALFASLSICSIARVFNQNPLHFLFEHPILIYTHALGIGTNIQSKKSNKEPCRQQHKLTFSINQNIPVMAAIAVRKKVVSIGHFSLCFRLQSTFYLLEEFKSNCMHWMHWKPEKNRTEPNELAELKYSKSLTQMICSFIFMLRHISKHSFIPFKIRKKD